MISMVHANELNRIRNMLKSKGYKLTPQRRAVFDVILRNEGRHMSTEEVFLEVKKLCPDIGTKFLNFQENFFCTHMPALVTQYHIKDSTTLRSQFVTL